MRSLLKIASFLLKFLRCHGHFGYASRISKQGRPTKISSWIFEPKANVCLCQDDSGYHNLNNNELIWIQHQRGFVLTGNCWMSELNYEIVFKAHKILHRWWLRRVFCFSYLNFPKGVMIGWWILLNFDKTVFLILTVLFSVCLNRKVLSVFYWQAVNSQNIWKHLHVRELRMPK